MSIYVNTNILSVKTAAPVERGGSGVGRAPASVTVETTLVRSAGTSRILRLTATGTWLGEPQQIGTPTTADGNPFTADLGAVNRISGMRAPYASLIGVFLGTSLPNAAPARRVYDAADRDARDFTDILLGQTFFIGDGLTSAGLLQSFLVPDGAEYLYLGMLDGAAGAPGFFDDNTGSLSVQYSVSAPGVVPEPATVMLMGAGLLGLFAVRRVRTRR